MFLFLICLSFPLNKTVMNLYLISLGQKFHKFSSHSHFPKKDVPLICISFTLDNIAMNLFSFPLNKIVMNFGFIFMFVMVVIAAAMVSAI